MVELLIYDRWGAQVGTLAPITCTRAEEVNGEDTLCFTTPVRLEKGDRVLFQDESGVWHEHVVCEAEEVREASDVLCTYVADNSLCETMGDYLEDVRNQNMTASNALAKALAATRWTQGATSSLGLNSQNFYHTNARAAINAVAETWGGEVKTEISVGTAGVSSRKVSVVSRLGTDNHRRFEYKKDLISVKRRVESDNVVTALYGYGAGLAATDEEGEETGGFSRKLTFGEVNGGLNYVADSAALARWGRPDGKGGKAHVFGEIEFSECEDARELLALTKEELPRRTQPLVSYEATVQDLYAAGYMFEGFALGDDVQIIDWAFAPALELSGRIMRIEWNYRDPSQTVVTLGNIAPAIVEQVNRQAAALQTLRDHSGAWDKAAAADRSYINGVIGVINDVMNATGGYVYMEPGEGITVYDRPVDQNPTRAIQLNGAGFRIANSKTGGSWNWRTFGTGDGFTADELNAGIIRGGSNWWNLETGDLEFKQGGIRDSAGKNFWDLGTGEFSLSASANVGGSTAADLVVNPDVQYGLSDAANVQPTTWTTTALWQQGRHLWSRVKMTHADGSITYTTPRRIANDKGMGAAEVIEQYYLSTSSTTQTGGSWQNSQPAWVKDRYYYTRSRITWSDGSVTYTTPQLARALTTANQSTNDLDEELTQREIFNRLTNNGQTQGIYLSGGLLYINATYLKTGIISDQYGRNTWNLTTGALSTNYMTANNITAKGTMETGYDTSYKAKMTGGYLRFFYNNAETIEIVSIPAYTSGAKGGYIQACNGATYLGLRAPKLYTARNTTEAGTTAANGDFWVTGFVGNPGDGWDVYSMIARRFTFINGICVTGPQ